MRIEIGKKYKIVATDPLFSDWRGVVAECKAEVNGLYEMHANNAYIYSEGRHLRTPYATRKQKMSNA